MTASDDAALQRRPVDAVPEPVRSLERWAMGITETELPLFAQNLSEISSVATARQSSAGDLAQAITMDVSMSVRLLKIANSPLLNPQDRDIDSVRTAVVLMGFDAVRDLAFSLSLVSELHRQDGPDRVVELLAHGFHAATIGQALARACKERYPEEVFVAGLLLNVGEMAFWARERPQARQIASLLDEGAPRERAEKSVLGFNLRELSRRLAEEWRMSGLLRAALSGPAQDSRCQAVQLGDAAAYVAERHGWDSKEGRAFVDDLTESLQLPRAELAEVLRGATEAASRMARRFGVTSIASVLTPKPSERSEPGTDGVPVVDGDAIRQPDARAELEAVRGLQLELADKPDLDRLMRLALDGLYRGAGIDRAFFAMLSQDRGRLRARYAAGCDAANVLDDCEFRIDGQRRHLFAILLKSRKTVWVDEARRQQLGDVIGSDIDRWATGGAFFAMPVFVRSRPLGLLYADRAASGRPLDDAAFTSFRCFGEQIAAGLARR